MKMIAGGDSNSNLSPGLALVLVLSLALVTWSSQWASPPLARGRG